MDKTKILVALAGAIAVAVVLTFACTPSAEPDPVVTVSAVATVASPAPAPIVTKPAVVKAAKVAPQVKVATKAAPKAKAKVQDKAEADAWLKATLNEYRAACRLFAADVVGEFYVRRGTDLTPDPRDQGVIPMSDDSCLQWLQLKVRLVEAGLYPFET